MKRFFSRKFGIGEKTRVKPGTEASSRSPSEPREK